MKSTSSRKKRSSLSPANDLRTSFQDRPVGETESHIYDCALTIFAAKGYDATSVRDIIRAAGVTQPTLYYHCRSKLDLFLRLVRSKYEESLDQLKQSIVQIEGCEPRLRAIMSGSFAYCAMDPRVPQLMFQTAFGPPIGAVSEYLEELSGRRFSLVRDIMRDGIKSGELAPSSAEGLALAFCCLMDQHINILIRQPDRRQRLAPKLADWLVTIFLRGTVEQRT